MPKEKSAGAIIYRMENGVPVYLLLHYQSGHWEFAKGHVEEGETEEETVLREVQEETGIDQLEFIPGFKESIKYFFRNNYAKKKAIAEGEVPSKAKAPWISKLVVFYLAATRTEKIKLSKEHVGYAWLSFDEALKKLTFKNAKNVLKKAHDIVMNSEL
jgi:bis(5'-nucleosidyl)-tetraphosphatase